MPKPQIILGVTFLGVFGAGAVSALVVERYVSRGPALPPPSALREGYGEHPGPGEGGRRPPGVGVGVGPGGGPGGGPGAGARPSYIAHRLGLTREQHEAMDRIWSATREQMGQLWAQRRVLQQERDEAMRQLLTDEQRQRAEQLTSEYEARLAELREATEALMREADRQTRALLTPEQLVRYEELQRERMSREEWGGRPGERGGGERGPGGRGPGGGGPGGAPGRGPGGGLGGGPGGGPGR